MGAARKVDERWRAPISGVFLRDDVVEGDERDEEISRLVGRLLDEPALLEEELPRLEALLLEHFADEEGPEGLFEKVMRSAPEALRSVEALQREHTTLLILLQHVLSRVQRQQQDFELTRMALEDLCVRIVRHESNETSLIQEALQTDLGGSG